MYKNFAIYVIVAGIFLLGMSIKQFLTIYGLYVRKKAPKSLLFYASFATFNSVVFFSGGAIWFFMIYEQLLN